MTTSTSSTATSYNVSTASSGSASISGLASGIDTTSLITSLMAVEAQPQTDLKNKLTTNQAATGVLQAINTKLAALTTSASNFSTGTALQAAAVTSTSTSITATASGAPSIGSIAMTVTSAATAQSAEFYGSGTSAATGWQTGLPSSYTSPLSLKLTANGTVTTLTPASYSAADVASAINASSSGVTANVITDSANVSHLVLTAATGDYSATATNASATPPTAPGFSLAFATGGTTDAPTYSTPTSSNKGADLSPGHDASVTIAGVPITQHSNTFTNTVNGLTITVSPTTTAGTTTTIGVTQDTKAITSSVTTLVSSLADVLKDISLALTAPSASSGLKASATNGGLLAGNSTLRGVQQALLAVVNSASTSTLSAGQNAAAAGIQVQEDGSVTVDAPTLATFLAGNPTVMATVLTNFGTSLSSATANASNPGVGTLSQLVASNQSDATTLTNEISDWDTRLAQRKANLTAQYTAMETALSKLQSQSTALTQALKSIDGTTSSN